MCINVHIFGMNFILLMIALILYPHQTFSLIWTNFQAQRPQSSNLKKKYQKTFKIINNNNGNGPVELEPFSMFGWSIANIGDLDGDDIPDLAVGAIGDSCIRNETVVQLRCGSVYILFLNGFGSVKSYSRISKNVNGGPPYLRSNDNFGYAVTSIGDVNGDNITDIAVGSPGTLDGGSIYILFLNRNGTVAQWKVIRGASNGNGPPLEIYGRMGSALGNFGDMDGDGINELAVQQGDYAGGNNIVYILFLSPSGDAKSYSKLILIDPTTNEPIQNVPFSNFGSSFSNIGDINNDGYDDMAIGHSGYTDSQGASDGGAVYICFMTNSTNITDWVRITDASSQDGITIKESDGCGMSVVTTGDINRDDLRAYHPNRPRLPSDPGYGQKRINDIIVGCPGKKGTGKIFLFFLDELGTRIGFKEMLIDIDVELGYSPTLKPLEKFGNAIAALIDFDGNGLVEFAVGAPEGGGKDAGTGSVYVLFIERVNYVDPYFDWLLYYLKISLPFVFLGICCICSTIFFFWYFRRKPDEIELAIKKAGVEVGLNRKRHIAVTAKPAQVYADDWG